MDPLGNRDGWWRSNASAASRAFKRLMSFRYYRGVPGEGYLLEREHFTITSQKANTFERIESSRKNINVYHFQSSMA